MDDKKYRRNKRVDKSETEPSPGVATVCYAEKHQEGSMKRKQKQPMLPATKCHRPKKKRDTEQSSQDILEGDSDQSAGDKTKMSDGGKIPARRRKDKGGPTFITIDLETTSLIRGTIMPHITQIAAAELKSGERFSTYVQPGVPISAVAQELTGIMAGKDGSMTVHGKRVESVSIQKAIVEMFSWIEQFSSVYLVAHFGRGFDFRVLMAALQNNNKTGRLFRCVTGLIDSLELFRQQFPEERSHKLVDLVRSVLGTTYTAHGAIADVKALRRLIRHCKLSDEDLIAYSFSPSDI